MLDKNMILAHFWANANKLVSLDGVEIDLHDDDLVVVSTTLKNTVGQAREIQVMAQFELDEFVREMEVQLIADVAEINLDLLFALLVGGKAGFHVMKP